MLQSRTSRVAYVLVWFFTGLCCSLFGIHNFIAGYMGRGVVQLLLSLLNWILFYGVVFGDGDPAGISQMIGSESAAVYTTLPLWIILFVWTLIEICTVKVDAQGRSMI